MNKVIAQKLSEKAIEISELFSNPNRALNNNNEIFTIEKILPLSENTGGIVFKKNTGKRALCFLYYINGSFNGWRYFFPSYNHIIGIEKVKVLLQKIEEMNFKISNNEEVNELIDYDDVNKESESIYLNLKEEKQGRFLVKRDGEKVRNKSQAGNPFVTYELIVDFNGREKKLSLYPRDYKDLLKQVGNPSTMVNVDVEFSVSVVDNKSVLGFRLFKPENGAEKVGGASASSSSSVQLVGL